MSAAKKSKIPKLNGEEKPEVNVPKGNTTTQKAQDASSAIEASVQTDLLAVPSVAHQITQHFSEEQFALVLSILNAKPDEMSTKDYCNEIKESIKLEEPRSNRIVDPGEFWRRRFESQCVLTNVLTNEKQTRIRILEKRLQSCRMHCVGSSSDDSEEEEVPKINKRSSESHDQPLEPAQKKKRRRYESLDTIPDKDDEMETDALALAYNNDHLMVANYLYGINKIRRSLHAESTSASCRELIELSWKAISDCIPRYIHCLAHLMSEIIECHKICAEVSTEHYKTIAGRELVGKSNIIYSLCSFFDKALSKLLRLCITKSDRVEISADNDEPMMIRFVANLLIGILRKIIWQQKNDLHKQIFEGMLAIILDHTGRLLSITVFKEDVAASKLPGHISSGELVDISPNEYALKSKYLVRILEMALKVQKENMSTEPTEELLKKAQRKLRNTLQNTILGASLMGLKMVEDFSGEPIDIPGLEGLEMYGEFWTLQCVFTMIDWDDNGDDEATGVKGEAVV
ncbi:hypothetical protein BOTCAL_0435g00030 [Botryotinia calthae]|uniref:Uncharacterized protein n=1 Tax=Botryotinia calthae TaxID=38488 RepID=A0A4Y8CNL4_9HELO|nr:hypothetical protein BOTCAL_0435g00030 [Botryotinia calthae]